MKTHTHNQLIRQSAICSNQIKKRKKIFFQLTIYLILFSSCNDEIEYSTNMSPSKTNIQQELAFPYREGKISSFEMKTGKVFYYTEVDGFKVFEGDILVSNELIDFLKKDDTTPSNNSQSKFANTDKINSSPGILSQRWTNSTINFKISLNERRDDILWAINHIKSNTNIDFSEISSGNYIDFISSDGCSSYIGMTGGRQEIRLATGCGRGSIIHEICHALGVFHEQSRPDRDNYVTINWKNITPGRSHNFDTELAYNYGDFDFGSIMMYSPWSFSLNDNPTITKKDGTTYSTQRLALSATDINALRDMYPGPNTIRTKEPSYQILDVGANNNGDNVHVRINRFRKLDVYKNDILFQSNTYGISSIDITSNGEVITNLNGFNDRFYETIDISEGGGNTYCLSKHQRNGALNLYKKNISNWTLITSATEGKRITVDSNGKPWVLFNNRIRLYNDDGSYSNINNPQYTVAGDELNDIGSAGNQIYVSMKNVRTGRKQLLKYSAITNQLIRQPGEANYLDGQGNGIVWTN